MLAHYMFLPTQNGWLSSLIQAQRLSSNTETTIESRCNASSTYTVTANTGTPPTPTTTTTYCAPTRQQFNLPPLLEQLLAMFNNSNS